MPSSASSTALLSPSRPSYSGPRTRPIAPLLDEPPPPRIKDELPVPARTTTSPLPTKKPEPTQQEDTPETTLGPGVSFKGELSFQRLLRIDGNFEGELLSEGKLIVGPTGIVKSNIRMREAVIDGRIEGNLHVKERLELRGNACIYGDIIAQTLATDEGVTIVGHVQITPKVCEPQAVSHSSEDDL
ncbi:MAG: polymer-forming cytoskeletal protein [Chlamydiia bacterium]|nr:polymer-forming cytoskeletal protein [Chlamydiia bacterium]